MSLDSICRLYSMTKAFVGVGVLRLVERGQLGLDDPAHFHLPEPAAARFRAPRVATRDGTSTERAKGPITLRQLLTHTSGMGSDIATGLDALTRKRGRWERMYESLTDAVDDGRINSLADFVEALSQLPLWQHPGREFYYSYGYDVLGFVLEHVSGLPLDDFLRREVFEPLGMHDTGFAVPRANAQRLCRLYRHTKARRFGANGASAELRPVDSRFVEGRYCRVLSGGGCVSSRDGGLTSTLRDYSKFLVTMFNYGAMPGSRKRLLSKASAALLMQNHCAAVGGLRPSGEPRICAHNRKGVGLNLLGEMQLEGCEADSKCQWFDGVPGLVQWGGAATTFYKYQKVNGRPLLLIIFTQVLPQDDGRATTASFLRMRSWAEAQPQAAGALAAAEGHKGPAG
uniref:Beta-lactamase-related domain-containing protein n=1 Tax=Zooxanthella nutricula TaxID=1333877 RepID=A0A7S2VMZ7_9DINO